MSKSLETSRAQAYLLGSPGGSDQGLRRPVVSGQAQADFLVAQAAGIAGLAGPILTLACPRFRKERRALLGNKSTWEELDNPDWRREGEETY